MNHVDELKQYAVAHARGLAIPRYRQILGRITTDDGRPGSWTKEWCRVAEQLQERKRYLDACRHYAMARFPYVDGAARQEAQERCVAAFERWRQAGKRSIERLDVDLPDGRVRCWASGLSTSDRRPLVVLMGGIVSVKEQNAAALAAMHRLGMAGVVAEMPGAGENPLRYDAGSWRMLSGLMDRLADRADVERTYALTLSFSGHMALRCAVDDSRIRSVITVGAPISDFFTDIAWQKRLPRITVDTLAHMTGIGAADLPDALHDRALTAGQLGALSIPVCYLVNLRDEIIPPGDIQHLKNHARQLRTLELDDVHGAPNHTSEMKLWLMHSLFDIRGVHNLQSAIIALLWHLRQGRNKPARTGQNSLRNSVYDKE